MSGWRLLANATARSICARPVNGLHYMRYEGHGRYGYTSRPTGYHRSRMTPRITCAANRKALGVSPFEKVVFVDPWVKELTGSDTWSVGDTGWGLRNYQVDLYWGEDEPTPGRFAKPAGTNFEYGFATLQVPSARPKPAPFTRSQLVRSQNPRPF